MLILGLNGSPHKEGNTWFLLREILKKAEDLGAQTQILDVADLVKTAPQQFCVACSTCTGQCFKDSALEEGFALLQKADGLVLGSPVYFGTVTAQLKAFFDMSFPLRRRKTLYNKVGAGVTVGASRFGGQETTIKALHDIMLVHGMIIVGDGHYDTDCGHHGICAVKPVG